MVIFLTLVTKGLNASLMLPVLALNIKEEYKTPIKEWLKRFEAISVREKQD